MNSIFKKYNPFDICEERTVCKALDIAIISLFFVIFVICFCFNYRKPFNYINICLYVIICCLIILKDSIKNNAFIIKFNKPYLFFGAGFSISMAIASFANLKPTGLSFTSLSLVFSSLFFISYFSSENQRNNCLLSFVYAFIIYCILYFAIYYKYFITLSSERIGSFFGNQNPVAYATCYGCMVSLYLSLFRKKYLFIFPYLLGFAIILSTGSRSGLIGLALFTVLLIFLFFGKKRWFLSIAVVGIISLVVVFVFTIPALAELKKRFISLVDSIFNEKSLSNIADQYRAIMVQEGNFLVTKRLFFGYGSNSSFLNDYSSLKIIFHNCFLEILFGYGIVCLIFYELLFFYPIVVSIKNKCNYKFIIPMLASVFVIQFFYPIYTTKIEFLLFAFCFSMVKSNDCVMMFQRKKNNNESAGNNQLS